MVGTLPGRTQGLGLITERSSPICSIGRVDYAQLNLWATLDRRRGALGVGRFIDRSAAGSCLRPSPRRSASVVLMSRVTSFAELAIAVTLTRALGQSALSVVSLAMVGQWFVRRIDMAMAIYSVVLSVGFMIAFPVVGSLVQSRGWRFAWFASAPRFCAASFRSRCWSCGEAPNRSACSPTATPDRQPRATPERRTPNQNPVTQIPRTWNRRRYASRRAAHPPSGSSRSARRSTVWSRRGSGLFNESILAERGFGPNIYSRRWSSPR